jgi:hypothetical protein
MNCHFHIVTFFDVPKQRKWSGAAALDGSQSWSFGVLNWPALWPSAYYSQEAAPKETQHDPRQTMTCHHLHIVTSFAGPIKRNEVVQQHWMASKAGVLGCELQTIFLWSSAVLIFFQAAAPKETQHDPKQTMNWQLHIVTSFAGPIQRKWSGEAALDGSQKLEFWCSTVLLCCIVHRQLLQKIHTFPLRLSLQHLTDFLSMNWLEICNNILREFRHRHCYLWRLPVDILWLVVACMFMMRYGSTSFVLLSFVRTNLNKGLIFRWHWCYIVPINRTKSYIVNYQSIG